MPNSIEMLGECVCPEHGYLWGECPHGCIRPVWTLVNPQLDGESRWHVNIMVNGFDVLTISNDNLAGIDSADPYWPVLKDAAMHLCSFLGWTVTEPESDFLEDSMVIVLSEPMFCHECGDEVGHAESVGCPHCDPEKAMDNAS